ncbi:MULTISPECIES: hypothetical protein [Aerosakkonema]|uniref:hypothetical protein n=1 Tax=Aerosakkonema TaxID=1246629 RepID=UPI0035B6D83D
MRYEHPPHNNPNAPDRLACLVSRLSNISQLAANLLVMGDRTASLVNALEVGTEPQSAETI